MPHFMRKSTGIVKTPTGLIIKMITINGGFKDYGQLEKQSPSNKNPRKYCSAKYDIKQTTNHNHAAISNVRFDFSRRRNVFISKESVVHPTRRSHPARRISQFLIFATRVLLTAHTIMVGFFDGSYTTEVTHNLTFLGGADCRLSIATRTSEGRQSTHNSHSQGCGSRRS